MFYELKATEDDIFGITPISQDDTRYQQLKEVIETDYNLGTVEAIFELYGGFTNKSYGIYTNKNGKRDTWFFRKYMRNKQYTELMMEHTLLLHVKENGFDKGAAPIYAKNGTTYAKRNEKNDDGSTELWYYAVYDFIPGFAKFDWERNKLPKIAYRDCAKIYAEFHNAGRDFDPQSYSRAENNINLLMEEFPRDFRSYLDAYKQKDFQNRFSDYFENSQDFIKKMCDKAIIPQEDFEKLPIVPNQCDPHPANFKFNKDNTASGIFDFDWAKMDIRLFELGFSSYYFFEEWNLGPEEDNDGAIRMNEVADYITTYNNRLKELGRLTPLTDLEKKYFFESLIMGDMYLVRWASELCYKEPDNNSHEFLYYMQHLIRSLKWLEKHETEIREISAEF